jgi:hypothetical protein
VFRPWGDSRSLRTCIQVNRGRRHSWCSDLPILLQNFLCSSGVLNIAILDHLKASCFAFAAIFLFFGYSFL